MPQVSLSSAFGQRGNGPGEFVAPSALRIDSVVTIPDMRQVCMNRFTLDGEHLETRSVSGPVVPSAGLAILRNDVAVSVTSATYMMSSSGIEGDSHGSCDRGVRRLQPVRYDREPARRQCGMAGRRQHSAIAVADGIAGTIAIFRVPDSPGTETETPQLPVDTVAMSIAGHPVTRADRERAEADFRRNNPNVRGQVTFEGWPTHWSVAIKPAGLGRRQSMGAPRCPGG